MLKEITAMFDNGVYELVEPPKGCTIIGNKWVFRVKTKADGTLDKLKARLVARGYRISAGLNNTQLLYLLYDSSHFGFSWPWWLRIISKCIKWT